MRRRQFLPTVAAFATVPLAGCAAPTTLSDSDRTVDDGRETLVYRHDDERLFEFGVAAGEPAEGTLSGSFAPFSVTVGRADTIAFDALRYAFTTTTVELANP